MAGITIIGTGHMAKAIATLALRAGYEVIFHSRDPEANSAELKSLPGATESNVSVVPYSSAVSNEIIFLAVPWGQYEAVTQDYAEKAAGKVLVDIGNAIDWSKLELIPIPAGSLADQTAQLAPKARVVKGFNTVNHTSYASGKIGGLPIDIFLAGDDQTAKQQLIDLIDAGGMRGIDAGPLKQARELEILEHTFVNMQVPAKGIKAIKIVSA